MRCSNCGAEMEIQSGRESGIKSKGRQDIGRVVRRFLLALFSSGWAMMAAISEYFQAMYITKIHTVDFSQQTPAFFQEMDVDYRFQSSFYFMGACLWLTLVLFVWAWKLSTHIEATRSAAGKFSAMG